MAMQPAQVPQADVALAHAGQVPKHPHPLRAALGWELRRVLASRASWVMAASTFAFFGALMLLFWGRDNTFRLATSHGALTFDYPETSVWGLLVTYPQDPGTLFGLLLPFVCADGLARDLTRRTHELVMTTALPGWAYVWGRYLAGLLFSLVLATVILLDLVTVTTLLHIVDGGSFPSVAMPSVLAIWALVVLPVVFLLSGLSFALGTLLPRRSGLVKLGVLLVWFACSASLWYLLNPDYLKPNAQPSPYVTWDPTSIAPTFPLEREFVNKLSQAAQTMDAQAFLRYERALQQSLPDVTSWIVPHLVWATVGLAAVTVTAVLFRRFRNAMS